MRFNFAQLSVLLNQHYSKRLFIVFWNELGISTVTTVVQIRTSYLKKRKHGNGRPELQMHIKKWPHLQCAKIRKKFHSGKPQYAMHYLPQRIKPTFFVIFSNGAASNRSAKGCQRSNEKMSKNVDFRSNWVTHYLLRYFLIFSLLCNSISVNT